MTVIKDDVISPGNESTVEKWPAEFKVEFSNSEFEPTKKIAFDGYLTAEGQRYFWGFGPSQDETGWVFRLDFNHFQFDPGIDYRVGSGGFGALLVEGGSAMISGGRVSEGIMRIKKIDPDEGKIEGDLLRVKAEGGRPDGSDMEPAFATVISFISKWERA